MMKVTVLLVSCFLWVQLISSTPANVLDANEGQLDLDNLVKNICWKNSGLHNQISRFSTIDKLIDYFEDLPVEHQYSSCGNRNLDLLKHLQALLSTGNNDVCSDEKLKLVESFHYNYISSHRRAQLIEAPKMIKSFFMHYAAQVSDKCAQRSEEFFAKTASTTVNLPTVDKVLEQFSKSVGIKDKLDTYDDLFFIWGVVDGLPKGMHGKLADYIVSGPKRMALRAENSQNFVGVQDVCLSSVKPIYSNTLLPAMRLIDLGYYPSSSNFLKQLNENAFVNRLYKLALLCETALPVRMVEGEGKQTVLLKPEEVPEESVEVEKSSVVVEPVVWSSDSLSISSGEQAKEVAKRVASDLRHRRRNLWKLIKRVVKGMKKSSGEKIVLGENNENIEDSVKDVVEHVDEVESQDISEENEEELGEALVRSRRESEKECKGFMKTAKKILVAVGRVTLIIIFFAIRLAIALLLGLQLMVAYLFFLDKMKEELHEQISNSTFNVKLE